MNSDADRDEATAPDNNVHPKLAPDDNTQVSLVSDHLELKSSEKLIFRYEVSIIQTVYDEKRGNREIDWCSSDSVQRNERQYVCFTLLQKANEMTEFFSRETVIVYDNSRMLFSSEKLRDEFCGKTVIKGDDLPEEFSYDGRLHRGSYAINIVPVCEHACSFVLGIKEGQRVPFTMLSPGQHTGFLQEVTDPKRRLDGVTESLNILSLCDEGNEFLSEQGIHISEKPMTVESQMRDLPSVQYRDGIHLIRNTKWTSGRFIVPAKIDKFLLLFNAHAINRVEVQRFEWAYLDACRAKGMFIPDADIHPLKNVVAELELIMQQQNEGMLKDKKLPFVILIDADYSQSHGALKYFEVLNQVITQQLTAATALNPYRRQTMATIVAKTNQKCFGQNYMIEFKSNFISTSDTLIIGYGVSHPTDASAPARQNGLFDTLPSVVGFSFNGARHQDSFIGGYAYQTAQQERVERLRSYIPWMLELFVKNRGKRPERIVIIRDGVSERLFRMVLETEVGDIRKGCTVYSPDYKPKLMVVTVTKPHEKRFFSVAKDGTVRNPTPGTVVDNTVTRAEKDTANMPAYCLLVNEIGNPARDNTINWLVDFLIGLCCSHQIVTSAVSIPEPVFQAEEWAKRGDANFRYLKSLMDGGARDLINQFVGKVKDPRNPGNTMVGFKWPAITTYLQYCGKRLQATRANA